MFNANVKPNLPEADMACTFFSSCFVMSADDVIEYAAQQSVQLTALRRGLAVSIFINVVLLAVVLFTIGGN